LPGIVNNYKATFRKLGLFPSLGDGRVDTYSVGSIRKNQPPSLDHRRWLSPQNMNRPIPSSGMLRHVALVRTDISEERIAYIFGVTKVGELETTLAVTSNRSTLRRSTEHSSETSFFTKTSRHHIPEDGIFHSHRREKLKSYIETGLVSETLCFLVICNFGRWTKCTNPVILGIIFRLRSL
jgi:hypothetical protein